MFILHPELFVSHASSGSLVHLTEGICWIFLYTLQCMCCCCCCFFSGTMLPNCGIPVSRIFQRYPVCFQAASNILFLLNLVSGLFSVSLLLFFFTILFLLPLLMVFHICFILHSYFFLKFYSRCCGFAWFFLFLWHFSLHDLHEEKCLSSVLPYVLYFSWILAFFDEGNLPNTKKKQNNTACEDDIWT